MQFGDYLVFVSEDQLFGFDGDSLSFGWNISTGAPIVYLAGHSYSTGDAVFVDDGAGNLTPWYAVQPVSGVFPEYTPASFPYWSRYPDKPVGTHPTVSYTFDGTVIDPDPWPLPGTRNGTSHVTIKLAGAGVAEIVGTLSAVTYGADFAPPYYINTYSDWCGTTYYDTGVNGNNPVVNTVVQTLITNHPSYLAVADLARSALA